MSCNLLTNKDPEEMIVITFDFSDALVDGEVLTSIVALEFDVTMGTDPDPQAILAAAPLINTTNVQVQAPITGGLDGVNYSIKAVAATNNPSKRLAVTAVLPVRNQ